MRRVLAADHFGPWLTIYLPKLPAQRAQDWLPCAEVDDEADGRECICTA